MLCCPSSAVTRHTRSGTRRRRRRRPSRWPRREHDWGSLLPPSSRGRGRHRDRGSPNRQPPQLCRHPLHPQCLRWVRVLDTDSLQTHSYNKRMFWRPRSRRAEKLRTKGGSAAPNSSQPTTTFTMTRRSRHRNPSPRTTATRDTTPSTPVSIRVVFKTLTKFRGNFHNIQGIEHLLALHYALRMSVCFEILQHDEEMQGILAICIWFVFREIPLTLQV